MGDGHRWRYRSRCALARSAQGRVSTLTWGVRFNNTWLLRARLRPERTTLSGMTDLSRVVRVILDSEKETRR